MTSDPRLRLLGGGSYDAADAAASAALAALDGTHVVVRVGPGAHGAYSSALAATVAILARLFPHVTVESTGPLAANWWGAATTTDLLTRLAALRPTAAGVPSRTVIVSIGSASTDADWYIGGGDYTARLGRRPQPLEPRPEHALGVHAAACLLVSQLLVEVLAAYGFNGVQAVEDVVFNLVDYTLAPAPAMDRSGPTLTGLELAVAGVGSVGSSALALLATAEAPAFGAETRRGDLLRITTVDHDAFDPTRNPFRYPALIGGEADNKAVHIAARLRGLGMTANAVPMPVAAWARNQTSPGWDGLLMSSVDTLNGRQDVTDVLARETLSLGVDGLTLHSQRERFGDGYACPFCDYVSSTPPLSQAGNYSELTGLSVTRVLALLATDVGLEQADLTAAVDAGRLAPDRVPALLGARLADLVRQAYAEIELRGSTTTPSSDPIALAAPQVSWFAGVLAAVEVAKQLRGLPLVDRRVDFDLSGLPSGLMRRMAQDSSGRCLCRSGVRARWYRAMYPG